ncbi:hypothetical protein Tco_0744642 [Tanacetum coccineum]
MMSRRRKYHDCEKKEWELRETVIGMDISQKGQKQSQTDKTEHGNGKSAENQSRRLQGLRMIDIEVVWNQWLRLEAVDTPEALDKWSSPSHSLDV